MRITAIFLCGVDFCHDPGAGLSVQCVVLGEACGLCRGKEAEVTAGLIQESLRPCTLGRIFNVLGAHVGVSVFGGVGERTREGKDALVVREGMDGQWSLSALVVSEALLGGLRGSLSPWYSIGSIVFNVPALTVSGKLAEATVSIPSLKTNPAAWKLVDDSVQRSGLLVTGLTYRAKRYGSQLHLGNDGLWSLHIPTGQLINRDYAPRTNVRDSSANLGSFINFGGGFGQTEQTISIQPAALIYGEMNKITSPAYECRWLSANPSHRDG